MSGERSTYEITVDGRVDDLLSVWFGDVDVRHRDGVTVITAHDADQARLHGVLAALRDLNAALLSLRTIADEHRG